MNKNQSLDSENSSQLNEATKAKVEALIKAFNQIDKNLDNQLSRDEIVDFINSNSKGQKCDLNLINKLMKEMDLDVNGEISVEEFIKAYVDFESNLTKTFQSLQMSYKDEQRKYQEQQREAQKVLNEEKRNNDMSKNAKITMIITNVNYHNIKEQPYRSMCIQVRYRDVSKETKYYSIEDKIFVNQQFEFFPVDRQVNLDFILKGKDSMNNDVNIGTNIFSLNAIDTQSEYLVDILISDRDDVNKRLATINSKIIFFWSDYLVFRDEMGKTERRMNKLKENIEKTNMYVIMMNNPINPYLLKEETLRGFHAEDPDYNSSSKLDIKQHNYIDYGPKSDNLPPQKDLTPLAEQLQDAPSPIFAKIEEVLKKTFKQQTIQWRCITKVMASLLFAFSLLNLIYRPDFPSAGLGLLLFALMSFELDIREVKKYLQWIIYGVIVLIVIDFLWIIMMGSGRYTANEQESVIRKIAFFSSCVNVLVKGVLICVIFMQKNQIK